VRKKIIIALILVSLFFTSVSLATSFERKKHDDLYQQLELFSDVLSIVESDYVEEVKSKELIYGSLRGMLSSLDAHSQFMDADTYNELKVDTEGKFGGLGIEISLKEGLPTVITPIEDTPAWKAGLKAGDKIVKINNELTRGLDLITVIKKLRGKPQTAVNLTVLREDQKKLLEFQIVRAIIQFNDIKEAKILEDGIGYIRMIEFRETTPKDFNAALDKLSKLKMHRLILDLRNNPGGVLESALEITSKFLPADKLVVYTKGRKEGQNLQFTAQCQDPLLELPLAVLINEGSASGSEIVAAALQDYKRATIFGAKSFGKGSVQTVIPLSDGSALKLTTSKYFTPLGKEIQGKGVVPDLLVKAETKEEGQGVIPKEGHWDYREDAPVMAAINFLKAK